MVMFTLLIGCVVALLAVFAYRRWSRPVLNLPPGPKPLPLVGNIRDFPTNGVPEYRYWLKHKDLYGGISSVSVMGMTLIIIHDEAMAKELLDQHSSKTSGRPTMVMANELCGYESIVLCQGYTPTFRRYRKYLHQELGTKASAARFQEAQDVEVNRQLVRAFREPQRLLEHFKTTAAATVLKMAYGYAIEPQKPDVLVDMIDQMMKEFSLAAAPMAWAVDIMPALRYLPDWFPGTSFKQTARRWRKSIQASAYLPYRFVQKQLDEPELRPSYVSRLVRDLERENDKGMDRANEEAIIWTAASLYGAAADTTVITLTAFTLAMLKFPHVQQKAQEEIDREVGPDRLLGIKDREDLPYVNALVKEAMRWWPIAPMGFPHTATEAFDYNEYRIPKGAMLLPAVWWFLHDPEIYTDPELFDPDRFLPPRNEPDPSAEVFGYGRRICPGRFFADTSLFLNIAHSLAVFNITKKAGKDGEEIDVDVRPQPGILTYPTKFEFEVTVRSKKHEKILEELERNVSWDKSDAEHLDSIDDFNILY